MTYRKFQADQLFTGTGILGAGQVLITDEQGTIETIVPETEAGLDIQRLHGILSPGFVNCHCHLELSHMKGLVPEGTGLVDFVFKVVTERHFPDEAITAAIATAEEDMRKSGIVAVGDICNNLSTLPQKQKNKLAYYNFIETSGWSPAVAQTRFDKAMEFYQAFNQGSGMPASVSPHAPYSVSEALWQLMMPYFPNRTVTIHNQETAFEDTFFEKGSGDFTRMYGMMKLDTSFFTPSGQSSLRSCFPKLRNAKQVLLVHNTFTKEADVQFANSAFPATNWCLCINANQYIEKAVPPIDLFRSNQCRLVVGTDSLASNKSLNILDELKTIMRFFPHIPLTEPLQWATLNGAHALQMSDRLGSFEKGKRPGIVLIDGIENENISQQSSSRVLL